MDASITSESAYPDVKAATPITNPTRMQLQKTIRETMASDSG
jgi:hypothetical protein